MPEEKSVIHSNSLIESFTKSGTKLAASKYQQSPASVPIALGPHPAFKKRSVSVILFLGEGVLSVPMEVRGQLAGGILLFHPVGSRNQPWIVSSKPWWQTSPSISLANPFSMQEDF